jgi:hypothetical protein
MVMVPAVTWRPAISMIAVSPTAMIAPCPTLRKESEVWVRSEARS